MRHTTAVTDPDRPVTGCICFDTLFAKLKDANVRSLEEAGVRFGCGTKCGLCRPYIELMLSTGETAFEVISEEG